MFIKFHFFALILLTLIFPITLMAQKYPDYKNEWTSVKTLEEKGLIQSAREKVYEVLKSAVSSNNSPQQVKACIYLMKYSLKKDETPIIQSLKLIDSITLKSKEPTRSMLLSLKADLLVSYLGRYQYQIKSITQLAEENSNDIETWSAGKFKKEIVTLYELSLEKNEALQSANINNYQSLLSKGVFTEGLRPTLYDLLANRAINSLSNILNTGNRPANAYSINDEVFFQPAEKFISLPVTVKNQPDILATIISIYQNILRFHLNNANPDAFIDADLERLKFIRQNTNMLSGDELYETALLTLENKYTHTPVLAEVMAERAGLYYAQGMKYQFPEKIKYKNEIKRSYELCKIIIQKYPGSLGAAIAGNLLLKINAQSLQITTETVVIPNEPFKALISYNNIGTVYGRIYKVSTQEMRNISGRYYNSGNKFEFSNRKIFRELKQLLPAEDDYREHYTEIAFEPLPVGSYILIISADSSFSYNNSIMIAKPVYVSNLAIVYDHEKNISVVERNSGLPVPNARLQLWLNKYNSKKSAYEWIKEGNEIMTDADGHAEISENRDENYYGRYIEVITNNDQLATQENFYLYSEPGNTKEHTSAFLFTDRAIYRPGQKLFVKGILYTVSADENKTVAAFQKSKITLTDANGKEVKSIAVTSNEFGSYTAEFNIPASGLTGTFTLTDEYTKSSRVISVEEYKRPKFKVSLEKPNDNFRVGDTVKIKGSAMAYAGNSISGASLTYHITRQPRFPRWWYAYRGYQPASSGAEISSGEAETDESGNFLISFNAIPDESIERSSQPKFDYLVTVDVTDLNGETRSSSISITAAYQSMELSIESPEKIISDSLNSIKIYSLNLGGASVPATITTQLLYLKDPHKIFKERYWKLPDVFSITREEHDRKFPNDPYYNEDQMMNWDIRQKMLERTDTTTASGKYTLGFSQLPTGWYKLIATAKDVSGDTIRAEKILMITDGNGNFSGTVPPLSISSTNQSMQPGEKNVITMTTGFEKAFTIAVKTGKNNNEISYPKITETKPFSFSVRADSADLGGIGFSLTTVKHNRFYSTTKLIDVPYTGKELEVSYESFRDKLEPGSKETWTVHVQAKKNEHRIKEVLANMYDASLDQITNHNWPAIKSLWPNSPFAKTFTALSFEESNGNNISYPKQKGYVNADKIYPDYRNDIWLSFRKSSLDYYLMSPTESDMLMSGSAPGIMIRGRNSLDEVVVTGYSKDAASPQKEMEGDINSATENKTLDGQVPVRSNFNETAFFYPQLKTDANGNISYSFTIPEALTQWKLMTLAHTPDLASGYDERFVVTQKKLMVQPNLSRFVREGDRMEIPAKISNLSDKEISGTANLQLFDLATGNPVDGLFQNQFPDQYFSVEPGKSMLIKFPIAIPNNFNSALKWQIKAVAADKSFADGETDAIPVLSNRVLVTETLPMYSSVPGKKDYRFEKLINSQNNSSLSNYGFTLEYSSNPAWYAVQALPYLMEFPYECAEQTFNRFYANSIAAGIINKYPKIKSIFEQWKTKDTSALLSNLEKNQELKTALLEETPWVMEAKNEGERKQQIATLFNLEKLSAEQAKALKKVIDAQQENGGFSWFNGGEPNRYMSQYILTGIGHLKKLAVMDGVKSDEIDKMIERGLNYADREINKEYQELVRTKQNLKDDHLSYLAIQYLYLRSFFPDSDTREGAQTAVEYYTEQAKKNWLKQSKYMQAMIALALNRKGDHATANGIIKSLKENALSSEEMGMYWAAFNHAGYYWYQAPIESQAMMIEAFSEIENNQPTINALKTWLLRQKQTQNWGTTKATAEACYALLIGGNDWLANTKTVTISLNGNPVNMPAPEAGTGYQKKTFAAGEITPSMGKISVDVPEQGKNGSAVTWGAAYWQYFENQDKVSEAAAGISITKKILVEKNSDKGPVLIELKEGEAYHIGDKVKIRLVITSDRNLEFVHLKDSRPAALEPGNILSGYQWQNGLGYYQSTRDASSNFFFQWLPKGTYVFEYPAFVSQSGDFSSGIATLQCMYAPEFSGHSSGQRIEVDN